MPLGGAKVEYFSCFHSSCQWGLRKTKSNLSWCQTVKLSEIETIWHHQFLTFPMYYELGCKNARVMNWNQLLQIENRIFPRLRSNSALQIGTESYLKVKCENGKNNSNNPFYSEKTRDLEKTMLSIPIREPNTYCFCWRGIIVIIVVVLTVVILTSVLATSVICIWIHVITVIVIIFVESVILVISTRETILIVVVIIFVIVAIEVAALVWIWIKFIFFCVGSRAFIYIIFVV